MNIERAQNTDLDSIQTVIETAFSGKESNAISKLAADLCSEATSPSIMSLVAKGDDQVIGYVSYSPIFLKSDTHISGYILAPLAVSPEHQTQGVGTNLIKRGMDMLTEDGVDVLLVYGDPEYYGRFGFKDEIGGLFMPSYPLEYPFGWRGLMLNETAVPVSPVRFECVAALSKSELW